MAAGTFIPNTVSECFQVQNVSQSMEVVDLRTSRDLQYVQDSEPLLRGVDGRLHTYVSNPRALTSKGLQVQTHATRARGGLSDKHARTLHRHATFGVKTLISRLPSWTVLTALRHLCVFHREDNVCLEAVNFHAVRSLCAQQNWQKSAASMHTFKLSAVSNIFWHPTVTETVWTTLKLRIICKTQLSSRMDKQCLSLIRIWKESFHLLIWGC